VYNFGADPGAGNVVKLCGNFAIACAIEALAEALALAEKNGVDRTQVEYKDLHGLRMV
jgi:3-hydroxyisobutyrate dehydrogenase-like beta-hydroxyacid dehydrogenase